MKISLNWLKDYVQLFQTAEEIAEMLSNLGLPYEGIEHTGDDDVIDVEVTSNRGDCLSHIGIARELAAVMGQKLALPAVDLEESGNDISGIVGVEITSPELCGRYTARVIEGVKVGPSPDWLKKRLEAIGMRSVNNVVDATNYAMAETGQPPHAFDYKKITGGKIIVRKAAAGETIISIDGTRCELSPEMLVIADTKGPVAVAGVMGGLHTEVSETTDTILLEDAYFDPVCVRKTSRKLNLPSEAAYRFERIVDIEQIDWASKRTAFLITRVAGGKVRKGIVDVYPKKAVRKQAVLRLGRLEKLLGMTVPAEQVLKILSDLNFEPRHEGDSVICSVPSWRRDVYREADLIEEVARLYGYNKVPVRQKISIEVTPVDVRQKLTEEIGSYLNGCGFFETVNLSFVDEDLARPFAQVEDGEYLSVEDVRRKTANLLRQSLLGSLMGVLKSNVNVKNSPCRIFEIANMFVPSDCSALPNERAKIAIVSDGSFRELKGVVEGLIRLFRKSSKVSFVPKDLAWADSAAAVTADGEEIGQIGIISGKLRDKFDFKDIAPCAAELDFEQLMEMRSEQLSFRVIPKFPAIERDLSIVVDNTIAWSGIADAINKNAPPQLEEIRFIEVYCGKNIPEGKKSITLSLRFRDEDGTMTHDAVDRFQADIVEELNRATGAQLRTV